MIEEIVEEVLVEEVLEEEIVEEEIFEEEIEEEGSTSTVNLATQNWSHNKKVDYNEYGYSFDFDIDSNSISWWTGDYGIVRHDKAYIRINASDYKSVTLNYYGKNNTVHNSSITFGVFDNTYADDISGITQLIDDDKGSITFDLNDVSGIKYVGFCTWANSCIPIYDDNNNPWYDAGGDLYFTSIEATLDGYTLTYNANGGSGAPSSVSDITSTTISKTIPQRFGYTFLGWSTSSFATSATYKPGDSLTISNNIILYAVWQSPTVISSDVTNSSYSASLSFGNMEKYYIFTPSSDGKYRFESSGSLDVWIHIYSSSGTLLAYNDNGVSGTENFLLDYNFTSGTTYYLMMNFESIHTTGTINFTVKRLYTITYNANGGSGTTSSQTVAAEDTIALRSNGFTAPTSPVWTMTLDGNGGNDGIPTFKGNYFNKWRLEKSSGKSFPSGENYKPSGDITMYAWWGTNYVWGTTTRDSIEDEGYTVTFNANGGDCSESSLTSTITTSYDFLGWGNSASNPTRIFKSDVGYGQTSNYTAYAIWSPTTTDGSITLPTPTRDGYAFLGWSTDAYDIEGITGEYIPTEDMVLYAIWEPMGLVYINDGEFSPYQVWIYDDSGWNQYIPYIYTESGWEMYSG